MTRDREFADALVSGSAARGDRAVVTKRNKELEEALDGGVTAQGARVMDALVVVAVVEKRPPKGDSRRAMGFFYRGAKNDRLKSSSGHGGEDDSGCPSAGRGGCR
ncbi:hypothetical protein CDL15_Pgr023715 [Punica granatum]|uniref:Uncharacterized protein n=1 Tax=Punica granatum TaxID=22663 RepID=A0A218WWF0_PUNGR|nr:hypothetical protein CDL15_Pgr023715 [Punica granatum]PKI77387.1 hypothetical protein CRG98_002217 [Punica granatum]